VVFILVETINKFQKLKREIKRQLSEETFKHCLRVAQAANDLAAKHKCSAYKASLAGLLHDLAKDRSNKELLELAGNLEIPVNQVEKQVPYLLHAVVGAKLAEQEFGITDRFILQAIARHTIAGIDMTCLDMVVYLADTIEPARDFPGIREIRHLAQKNLKAAFFQAYRRQIVYLVSKTSYLHPNSVKIWNGLVKDFLGDEIGGRSEQLFTEAEKATPSQ
jgi:predicted HD superfamily hydrolase involved in NAD metabolism